MSNLLSQTKSINTFFAHCNINIPQTISTESQHLIISDWVLCSTVVNSYWWVIQLFCYFMQYEEKATVYSVRSDSWIYICSWKSKLKIKSWVKILCTYCTASFILSTFRFAHLKYLNDMGNKMCLIVCVHFKQYLSFNSKELWLSFSSARVNMLYEESFGATLHLRHNRFTIW